MRSCSAAGTICPAAERFLADGAPTGCCRSTADSRRRSTARWRPVQARAVTRCSSAIRTTGGHASTSSTIRRPLPTPLRSPPSGRQDFSPLGGERSQVIGPGLSQLDMGFAKQIRVGARRLVNFVRSVQRDEHAGVQPAGLARTSGTRETSRRISSMRNTPRQLQMGIKIIGKTLSQSSGSARAGVSPHWRERKRPRPPIACLPTSHNRTTIDGSGAPIPTALTRTTRSPSSTCSRATSKRPFRICAARMPSTRRITTTAITSRSRCFRSGSSTRRAASSRSC